MIYRWTIWLDEDQDELQVSLAVLDEEWEALCVFTKPCGPFNGLSERQAELRDEVRRWLRTVGHQQELPI